MVLFIIYDCDLYLVLELNVWIVFGVYKIEWNFIYYFIYCVYKVSKSIF